MKQKNTRNTKKVPQIIVVTLLSGLPICYAETALATSSSFGLNLPQSHLQQSAKSNQQLNLPKNYQGSRLYTFSTPSEDDLNTLKSTLSKYQSQLDTLLKNQPTNDSPELQTAIDKLQTKIQTLKSNIKDVEASLSTFKDAKTALDNALKAKTLAQKDLEAKKEILHLLQTSHEASKQELQAQQTAVTTAQAQLAEATDKLNQANQLLTNSDAALTQQNASTAQALQTLNERQTAASAAQASLQKAQENLQSAQQTLNKAEQETTDATSNEATAKEKLDAYSSKLQTKQQEVDAARSNYNQAISYYNNTLDAYNLAYSNYLSAQTDYYTAQNTLNQAEIALNQAQANYDNNLIPDPTWTPATHEVAYTRLVPVTTTTTTGGVTAKSYNRQGYNNAPPLPTSNEQPIATTTVSNIDFQWGGGLVLNSGRSEDVIVEFTGVITVPTTGYYKFYAPGDDGVQFFINGNRIINDWRDKGGGGSVSQDVYLEAGTSNTFTLYYYENGGGANVWLYYYTPNTGYQIVPAAWLGQQTTTETTYVEETYYVTEVIPGQVHPLIHDPALLPPLQEAQANYEAAQAAYATSNENWITAQQNQQEAAQNATAGYYQVIDKATVLNTVSAELDVYQNEVNQAQSKYDQANIELQQSRLEQSKAQENFDAALATSNKANANSITANSQLSESQDAYNTELQKSQAAQTSNEEARSNQAQALNVKNSASTSLDNATGLLDLATSNESSLKTQVDQATSDVSAAEEAATQTSNEQQIVKSKTEGAQTSYQRSLEVAGGAINSIPALIDEATTIFETPQGSPEIPTNLDADSLQEIDLSTIDPTELTEKQADLLVEAALETFETAEQGSPAYQQALDALALAAQQDDIVLDESIASIPGVGAAAQAVVAVLT